jgi:cobalt-zinc-cadmium efflux system outer membrane protein
MMPSLLFRSLLPLGAIILSGCATVVVDPQASREAMAQVVNDRSGRDLQQSIIAVDETASVARVEALLAGGLTADKAVEITLLQNRTLRALYTDLDVAQSDLVQASLLHNPLVDGSLAFPVTGGIVDFSFGAAVDVIDLLYVPLRKRVATARFEETKLHVAGEVLEFTWRAQTAFYRHQADEQLLEMRRQVAESAAASFQLSKRMRSAGNIAELELASARAFAEEARLDVRSAEIAARESREGLNALMGLWGELAATWNMASERLPDPPTETLDTDRIESRAIERSLDLAAAERLVVAAGEALGLDRVSALFPELVVGGKGERVLGEYEAGPTFTLPIPLFDHGQARIARAKAELERARELHHALAVQIRAIARVKRDGVIGHRDRALHYENVMLPVRERVVRETELQYNAMQIGPLDLFRAKEQQIETAARYVESLRDYWTARADLGLILAGRLPPGEPAPAPPALEQLPRFPFPTLQ